MKLLPPQLPPINTSMERNMPLQLPFRLTDLLWRYPFTFPHPSQPPSSPVMDFKNHLPTSLPPDPRIWSREDVATFLKWCEKEFDLPNFDMEMFQMNGKALCLLTKTDLGQRCPGVGDVLHNILQMLVRDSTILSKCLPSSPITPTSRAPYPLSPHSQPPTPSWSFINPPSDETSFQQAKHAANLVHFMNQSNSVTLSPAPSLDSQGSPQHVEHGAAASYVQTLYGNGVSTTSSGSNHSDSDEDSYQENSNQVAASSSSHGTPPTTPSYNMAQLCLLPPPQPRSPKQIPATITHLPTAAAPAPPTPTSQSHPSTPSYSSQPSTPGASSVYKDMPRQFFPNDMPEPNTNGRLLWDFLQQLLNDPSQRYTNYIAWKNQDSGVFKIVDPAGLAKLWGIQKNHLSMNYDKMSRALRYYYRVNILRKVQGERHCYQFLRNPTELKSIKNISLLRQQMSPTRTAQSTSMPQNQPSPVPVAVKVEPTKTEYDPGYQYYPWSQQANHEDDMPTDLSMPTSEPSTPTDLRKPSDSAHIDHTPMSDVHPRKRAPHHLSSEHHSVSSPKSPKQMTFSDKHRISMIVGENLQKLSRERDQHYASLNLKLEENPSAMIAT